MPVKSDIAIPIIKVSANPLIGPDVFKNEKSNGLKRIKPVINVAIFASRIASQALPKCGPGGGDPCRRSRYVRAADHVAIGGRVTAGRP